MKTVSILTHTDKTPMSIGMRACTHTHTDTHITEGQNLCGGKTIVHLVDDA